MRASISNLRRAPGWPLVAAFVTTFAVASCEDDPGATVKITGARPFRDPSKNVGVDVDLLGHEGLGGSVGVYCIRVVFVDPTDVREECRSDLGDGDTQTLRFVGGNVQAGKKINVRVRLDATDQGLELVAPP